MKTTYPSKDWAKCKTCNKPLIKENSTAKECGTCYWNRVETKLKEEKK